MLHKYCKINYLFTLNHLKVQQIQFPVKAQLILSLNLRTLYARTFPHQDIPENTTHAPPKSPAENFTIKQRAYSATRPK